MSARQTLDRYLQLLRLLPRHPRKITVQALRQQLRDQGYAITERSLQRDLIDLSGPFPLTCDDRERPYGWSWQQSAEGFNLPTLSIPEALTLAMVETHLRTFLPQPMVESLGPHFKAARQRLANEPAPRRGRSWLDKVRLVPPTQPLQAPKVSPAVHAAVSQALLEEKQLQISYRRAGTENFASHRIHPLGLIQRGTVLYLSARFDGYDDVRTLALHRMNRAEMLEEQAQRPKGFSLDDQVARGTYQFGGGEKLRLVVAFARESAEHLRESPLSEDQSIEGLDQARVRVSATVLDTPQLRWWLLGFGEYVEVLAPKSLRQEFARTAATLAQRYAKATKQ